MSEPFYPGRKDDPLGVMAHADRYFGGKALIVLGGPSGREWKRLRDEIEPDVILTANGATRLPGAGYWMLTENMNFCHNGARRGNHKLAEYLHVFDRRNTARYQLISHRSWKLLPYYGIDEARCICIQRAGYELERIPKSFSFREYGQGYLAGGISKHPEAWKKSVKVRTGTVGLQLLHHAGILGCAEVHTIGFDLLFRGDQFHHWYKHPRYEPDRFRTEAMFVDYKGVPTQLWWLETADFLAGIEPLLERDGLQWTDHSGGLLKMKGLQCAQ